VKVVKLKATKEEREKTIAEELVPNYFDVLVTTYQGRFVLIFYSCRHDKEFVTFEKNKMGVLCY
jgi:hypothetical protein